MPKPARWFRVNDASSLPASAVETGEILRYIGPSAYVEGDLVLRTRIGTLTVDPKKCSEVTGPESTYDPEKCEHESLEYCLNCSKCGECSESVDEDDVCAECRAKPDYDPYPGAVCLGAGVYLREDEVYIRDAEGEVVMWTQTELEDPSAFQAMIAAVYLAGAQGPEAVREKLESPLPKGPDGAA